MVRLKADATEKYFAARQDFNSNMVRLKAPTDFILIPSNSEFQFQHGTIKSV